MTQVTETIRNGVDTERLFATLDLIKAQPELAKFQFRATNRWIDGAHNRSTIKAFYAAGGEDATRDEAFELDAGEPAILLGTDTGPNPAEYLLHALAACLTTSIVYVAAARKVELTSVESTLTGEMDVRGALGVDDEPRNGFERIGVAFRVSGNAPEEKLREVVERARKRSAVYDMVAHGVPVELEVATDGCSYKARGRVSPAAGLETSGSEHALCRLNSQLTPRKGPASSRWLRNSPSSSPRARLSTTATAVTPSRRSTRSRAGYFGAPIPVELGGLGVSSAHDLVVASSRLARGDASVAIGVNMHLVAVQNMERRRQVALAAGQERRARGFASLLEEIARDGVLLAAAISERGQDLTRPGTVATRTATGWRIDGRKMFCTMSPAATHLYVAVRYADDEGGERYAYAIVPANARGVVVHHDWDALGMRASGSNSISFDGVEMPESGVRGGFRAGDPPPYMERNLVAGPFHAAASLGIAESADQIARHRLRGRTNGDARPRMQVADNSVDLAAARGVLSRAAALIDEHRAANPASDGTAAELGALFAEAQAAKAFVGEATARIVERALALSGGAGYLNGSPLARAYRDVRPAPSCIHLAPTAPTTTSPRSPSANSRRSTEMAVPAHLTPPPETRAFRDALGRFATGVAFITATPDGEPTGLIVNSLSSVSLEPPLVSFSPARSSLTWSRMRRVGRFGVNVLRRQHEPFVLRATPAGAARFAGLGWKPGRSGVPLVADAFVRLECEIVAEHLAGDHWIVVGQVSNLEISPTSDPLVFFAGEFASLQPAQ